MQKNAKIGIKLSYQLKIVCLLDLQFGSRFLCPFYMSGSVRFQFGKQNFCSVWAERQNTLLWSVTNVHTYIYVGNGYVPYLLTEKYIHII